MELKGEMGSTLVLLNLVGREQLYLGLLACKPAQLYIYMLVVQQQVVMEDLMEEEMQ